MFAEKPSEMSRTLLISDSHITQTGDIMQRQTAEIRENDAVIEMDGWKVVLRFSNQSSGGAMKSVKDILLNQRIALQKPPNICNLSDNLV